jgi:hypothetical protein
MNNTEQEVRLPNGWREPSGKLEKVCALRPARVRDEVLALGDFRVFLRPESLPLVLLARVVTRLGKERRVNVGLLERLGEADRRALEEAYREMNGYG